MRPKDLRFPFTWENRCPALYKGVLIVPQYYDRHDEWESPAELFSSESPCNVEYCSGNGDWVIERALSSPDQMWVAVEKQFERVRKIWSKMRNRSITNLLIVCGEAQTFTRHYLPAHSVQASYVNFPDPWPKERHAKNRLVQAPFVEQLSRVLRPGGKATFVTDSVPYSEQIIMQVRAHPAWQSKFPAPFYTRDISGYGNSWFQELWRTKGRDFHFMEFERQCIE